MPGVSRACGSTGRTHSAISGLRSTLNGSRLRMPWFCEEGGQPGFGPTNEKLGAYVRELFGQHVSREAAARRAGSTMVMTLPGQPASSVALS